MRNAGIALVAFIGFAVAGANTTGGLQIGLVVGAVLSFGALAYLGYRYLASTNSIS